MKPDIVEMMLMDGFLKEANIMQLVKSNPSQRATLYNLISAGVLSSELIEIYVVKKIEQGSISIDELDKIDEIDMESILHKVAKSLEIEYLDLDNIDIDIGLYGSIDYADLVRYKSVLAEESDSEIVVAFANPRDMDALDGMQRLLHRKMIRPVLAMATQIEAMQNRIKRSMSVDGLIREIRDDLQSEVKESDIERSSAILRLIELILKSSIDARASDIHIEATKNSCLVRVRIDGMLVESFAFDKDIFSPLASRVKLLANMDIAERRKPQDGRFSKEMEQGEFDFRVSTLPTVFGESIVIRVLDKSQMLMRLEDAGMSQISYDRFMESISKPYGIVLVTGPTGSGKSTTLYGAINAIRDVKDKIITVEDPVEYQLSGIQQVQVRESFGLEFADALRSILRQDPDKIMIGEIRDSETLRIAIQAALTGHLVLSTLHTNDAVSAIIRMRDMGIESYLLSGSLIAIQAQRLVRKICPNCKEKSSVQSGVLESIAEYLPKKYQFYSGTGCVECHHSGYLGRVMIAEVLVVSEKISSMITKGSSREKIYKQAIKEGFVTMLRDGIDKALDGVTSIDEVLRVSKL